MDLLRHEGRQIQTLVLRARRRGSGHVVDQLAQIEIRGAQLDLAGLDLREIENVVDDLEERVRGAVGGVRQPPLGRGELRVPDQVDHSQHAVHRCADLVTHVGEELGLGAARLLRGVSQPHGPVGRLLELQRSLLDLLLQGALVILDLGPRLAESDHHPAERLAQGLDLVAGANDGRKLETPAGHSTRGLRQRMQRSGDPAREVEGHQEPDDEDRCRRRGDRRDRGEDLPPRRLPAQTELHPPGGRAGRASRAGARLVSEEIGRRGRQHRHRDFEQLSPTPTALDVAQDRIIGRRPGRRRGSSPRKVALKALLEEDAALRVEHAHVGHFLLPVQLVHQRAQGLGVPRVHAELAVLGDDPRQHDAVALEVLVGVPHFARDEQRTAAQEREEDHAEREQAELRLQAMPGRTRSLLFHRTTSLAPLRISGATRTCRWSAVRWLML